MQKTSGLGSLLSPKLTNLLGQGALLKDFIAEKIVIYLTIETKDWTVQPTNEHMRTFADILVAGIDQKLIFGGHLPIESKRDAIADALLMTINRHSGTSWLYAGVCFDLDALFGKMPIIASMIESEVYSRTPQAVIPAQEARSAVATA